ncbi:hypothetical protein WJX82_003042 [Trebouxia sp. C0006]
MQTAKDLRRTLEFSATSWQGVCSLLQAMDDEDTDVLEKQLGMPHLSDHVPRALQGPSGPAKLLKACYADEIWAKEAFGDWKGKKNEMKKAAAEVLRSNMQEEKLKSWNFLETCLVKRVLENNKNANIEGVKRQKRQATVKQLQWELLCAWAQQVNKDEVSDEDENNRMKSAEREAAGSEAKQPKSAKKVASAQGVNQQQSDSALKPKKLASNAAPKQQANKRLSEDASSASPDKRKKQKMATKAGAAGGPPSGGRGAKGPRLGAARPSAQDPRLIIQKVVDLAQVVYVESEPTGCNRVIRKELVGQSKLKDLLDKVYGSDKVLTEGQVPININLNGRYDLFVNDVVLVELKNVTRLQKTHGTQIREYMSKLRCHHGVLINFPKDGATSISAMRFIYEDFGVELDSRTMHPT